MQKGLAMPDTTPTAVTRPGGGRAATWLAVFGPGIVVMLADTDVGSLVTAGQSGAQWGYRLLLLQFLLMPILYITQELTVRLGIYTGKGHGELICQTFGRFWGWVSAAGLAVATGGALLSEFSGVAAVGDLYDIPRAISLSLAAIALIAVVLTGSYRRVERLAIAIGLFELAFFGVAYYAHPSIATMAHDAVNIPFANKDYLYLCAANIGAVIMPWMVFYQQSAIADKGLRPRHLTAARADTAVGAVITQLVMAAALVACAAVIAGGKGKVSLDTVGDMAAALTPMLGAATGKAIFSLGVLGAGMVAAIVASLALAWGVGEVAGYARSLELPPRRAYWFYGVYAVCIAGGAAIIGVAPDLVNLNVGIQVMNALLLPLVLGFLVALSIKSLPPAVRLRGIYRWVVIIVLTITTVLGVYGGFSGAGLI
jgi:Mn2+/Fe2+ NRAMP family transporter